MSKNKIHIYDKTKECCGCGTCALVCPMKAISMSEKELGCLYPEIDYDKCVGCGKCKQICAFQRETEGKETPTSAYAAMAEEKTLLKKSASGGVFATIAKNILRQGGIVFGCSMELQNGKLFPMHIGIHREEELYKLQGSKYVQSFLGDTFLKVKEELKNKRLVLFSGTPCQVDALNRYLEKEDSSFLYTIDIICHGVPSTKLFQDYIGSIEEKTKKRVSAFYFRDKTWGWGLNAKYILVDKNSKEIHRNVSADISSYYSLFLESETYRQSCYSCKYASSDRKSDVTIGDYWCLEKEHPEYTVEQGGQLSVLEGVSCVLVNTQRGEELVELYTTGLNLKHSEYRKVAKWNRQLINPSRHTEKRKQIVSSYEKYGYKGVEKLFCKHIGIRYYVRILRNRRRQCKRERGTNIS